MIRTIPIGPYTLAGNATNQTHLCQLENGLNYEPHVRALLESLKPACLLDIGANLGLHSLSAASLGTTHVYAFEASPANVSLLAHNVHHNGLGSAIAVMPFAVADKPRLLHGNGCLSNLACSLQGTGDLATLCPALPIDLLAFPQRIDLVKLDVEGLELEALQGMAQTVAEDRPTIIVEICPEHLFRNGALGFDVLNWLTNRGYTVKRISGTDEIGDWLATR